jgi:hypothetical protein
MLSIGGKIMTGRERVKSCILFKSPDRLPRDLWVLPYVSIFQKEEFDSIMKKYPLDIGTSQLSPGWSDKVVKASAKTGSHIDDWGSKWYVGEPGVIGEVKNRL